MKLYVFAGCLLVASAANAQGLADTIGALGNAIKPSANTNVQIGIQTGGDMANTANAMGEGSAAAAGQNALIDASKKSGINTNIQGGFQSGGVMRNASNAVDGGMAAAGQNAMIKK